MPKNKQHFSEEEQIKFINILFGKVDFSKVRTTEYVAIKKLIKQYPMLVNAPISAKDNPEWSEYDGCLPFFALIMDVNFESPGAIIDYEKELSGKQTFTIGRLDFLLRNGALINDPNPDGRYKNWTPLAYACVVLDNKNLLFYLLKAGAKANQKGEDLILTNDSHLHYKEVFPLQLFLSHSSLSQDKDCLKLFVNCGAEIDAVSTFLPSELGRFQTGTLQESYYNLKPMERQSNTVLFTAIAAGEIDMARLLVEKYKADPELMVYVDNCRMNALTFAIVVYPDQDFRKKHPEIKEKFKKLFDLFFSMKVNLGADGGNSPLHEAAREPDSDVLKWVVDQVQSPGSGIDQCITKTNHFPDGHSNEFQATALHEAVNNELVENVCILLSAGSKPDNMTLERATELSDVTILRKLLEKLRDYDKRQLQGILQPGAVNLISKDDAEGLKLLIDSGLDIDAIIDKKTARKDSGLSLIGATVLYDSQKCFGVLKDAGASLVTIFHDTGEVLTLPKNEEDQMGKISCLTADNKPLTITVSTLGCILERSYVDMNLDGYDVLTLALFLDRREYAKEIFDVLSSDYFDSIVEGQVLPVFIAVQRNNLEFLELAKAKATTKNCDIFNQQSVSSCGGDLYLTPLVAAVESCGINLDSINTGVIETIKFLLNAGANPNLEITSGQLAGISPLLSACRYKLVEIVELFCFSRTDSKNQIDLEKPGKAGEFAGITAWQIAILSAYRSDPCLLMVLLRYQFPNHDKLEIIMGRLSGRQGIAPIAATILQCGAIDIYQFLITQYPSCVREDRSINKIQQSEVVNKDERKDVAGLLTQYSIFPSKPARELLDVYSKARQASVTFIKQISYYFENAKKVIDHYDALLLEHGENFVRDLLLMYMGRLFVILKIQADSPDSFISVAKVTNIRNALEHNYHMMQLNEIIELSQIIMSGLPILQSLCEAFNIDLAALNFIDGGFSGIQKPKLKYALPTLNKALEEWSRKYIGAEEIQQPSLKDIMLLLLNLRKYYQPSMQQDNAPRTDDYNVTKYTLSRLGETYQSLVLCQSKLLQTLGSAPDVAKFLLKCKEQIRDKMGHERSEVSYEEDDNVSVIDVYLLCDQVDVIIEAVKKLEEKESNEAKKSGGKNDEIETERGSNLRCP